MSERRVSNNSNQRKRRRSGGTRIDMISDEGDTNSVACSGERTAREEFAGASRVVPTLPGPAQHFQAITKDICPCNGQDTNTQDTNTQFCASKYLLCVHKKSKRNGCGHAGDRNRDLPQSSTNAKRMLYHLTTRPT